jgi:hypothetical protein
MDHGANRKYQAGSGKNFGDVKGNKDFDALPGGGPVDPGMVDIDMNQDN